MRIIERLKEAEKLLASIKDELYGEETVVEKKVRKQNAIITQESKNRLSALQLGENIVIKNGEFGINPASYAFYFGKRLGKKFQTRKIHGGTVITRII